MDKFSILAQAVEVEKTWHMVQNFLLIQGQFTIHDKRHKKEFQKKVIDSFLAGSIA